MKTKNILQDNIKSFLSTFSLDRTLVINEPIEEEVELTTNQSDSVKAEPIDDNFVPTTHIGVGTQIDGSITTTNNIVVDGCIKGDIKSSGNIRINGEIFGNVKGENITIINSIIEGEITANKALHLDDSKVVGNIFADEADINGQVNGNIEAVSACNVLDKAIVIGNISSEAISVVKNSIIDGQIKIKR